MHKREVFIDTIGLETRRAVVEDGQPVELAVAYRDELSLVGNLYLAKVVTILKGMHAAFVDIGLAKNAFLPMDDMPKVMRDAAVPVTPQGRDLRQGVEIIVQVVKEPGGDKGPRVSMNITLAGTYAVLLPTVQAMGISRHIEDAQTRQTLLAIGQEACPPGMGLVLRTAAQAAAPDQITGEIAALASQWGDLSRQARTKPAPAMLSGAGDLREQAERDLGVIAIEGPFSDTLESKLDKLTRRKVWLDDGGFLVFDRTEALTVIDVNSGKFTGKKNLDDTLLRLNTQAAKEIARQLRLRDIGGIILIDFVDMRREEDRESVLAAFEEALRDDRAKRHVHGFTQAGLLELTRRPLYRPLMASLDRECPHCHGSGVGIRPTTVAHRHLRDIRRRRASGDTSDIVLTDGAEVLSALEAIGLPAGVCLAQSEGDKQ